MPRGTGRATAEGGDIDSKGGTTQERGYLAAAHNESNSGEARLHAATEYCRLHEERTGVKLDPETVMHSKGGRNKK